MDRNKETENKKENTTSQPYRETSHNADPQQNMEGPVSSSTKQAGEVFDTEENKQSADERRDERM